MDSLTGIYTGLLRNTKSLKYTITGANGQVYYSKDCEYVGKSIYSYDYYRIVPAGVDAEYDGIEPWYGRCDRTTFDGSLEQREYGNTLQAGGVFRREYTITVE